MTLRIGLVLAMMAGAAGAAEQELGLMLGRLQGTATPRLGSGTALGANYSRRVAANGPVGFWVGANLLANPQRKVTAGRPESITDVATLYVTPEARVVVGAGRVRIYGLAGAGWAVYEHSRLTAVGAPNPGPRTATTGAFTYGGGVDIGVWRWLGLRGEVRDFYTGAPRYNFPAGRQHNVAISAGLVMRWGQ